MSRLNAFGRGFDSPRLHHSTRYARSWCKIAPYLVEWCPERVIHENESRGICYVSTRLTDSLNLQLLMAGHNLNILW